MGRNGSGRISRSDYHWIIVGAGQHRFLRPLFEALGVSTLRVWVEADVSAAEFSRAGCAGLVTAVATFGARPVAVAWSDFRVGGGAYGRGNSRRLVALLGHLETAGKEPIPLIYLVNSAGVNLMEGRRVFADAFSLWPALLRYSASHLVLTCATGKCLGLAPLLFGLGHYRVAVAGQTQINLTGPEVIELFFGKDVDFAESASAQRVHDRTDLVHELVPSIAAAFARFRSLLAPGQADSGRCERASVVLRSLLDGAPEELIPGWSESVRVFLGVRNGKPIGVFLNPPRRASNLITARALETYAAGLDLFRALRVPIVSLLDSPGVDPRFDQSDANNLRLMLGVGERIIRYPWGAMGVVTGRCFGGASTLAFPKVFGGRRLVALAGCQVGAMHESIVTRLLQGSPRLLADWQRVARNQGPGLEDLLSEGTVDAVIDVSELPAEIDRFLAGVAGRSAGGGARQGQQVIARSPDGRSP